MLSTAGPFEARVRGNSLRSSISEHSLLAGTLTAVNATRGLRPTFPWAARVFVTSGDFGAKRTAPTTFPDLSLHEGDRLVALRARDTATIARPDRPWWRVNLFRRVLDDQRYLVTSWWPSEFGRTRFSAPLIAGVSLAAASSIDDPGVDQKIVDNLESRNDGATRTLSHAFTTLGNPSTEALMIGAAYLTGRLAHDGRLSETASLAAEAGLSSGIWNTALKALTARTRPGQEGNGRFFQYDKLTRKDNGSFPSGHAMGAFALATVVAEQYRHTRWVPWVAYSSATLVSLSRVALARHYPSDAIVGAVLGNSIGRMVIVRARGEHPGTTASIQPLLSPDSSGWGLAYHRAW